MSKVLLLATAKMTPSNVVGVHIGCVASAPLGTNRAIIECLLGCQCLQCLRCAHLHAAATDRIPVSGRHAATPRRRRRHRAAAALSYCVCAGNETPGCAISAAR